MPYAAKLLGGLIVAVAASMPLRADPLTPEQGCNVVLELAKSGKIRGSASGTGEFYCESAELDQELDPEVGGLILVELHQTYPEAPADWVGSTFIARFAVDPSSGAVYSFDSGEWEVGAQFSPGTQ